MSQRSVFSLKSCKDYIEDNNAIDINVNVLEGKTIVGKAVISYTRPKIKNNTCWCNYTVKAFKTSTLKNGNNILTLEILTKIPRPAQTSAHRVLSNIGDANALGWLNITNTGNWHIMYDNIFVNNYMTFTSANFLCYCTFDN